MKVNAAPVARQPDSAVPQRLRLAHQKTAEARELLWRVQGARAVDAARDACNALSDYANTGDHEHCPPILGEAWAVLALAYSARSKPTDALEATDFVLSLPKERVSDIARSDLWHARCKCLIQLGLLGDALAAAERAIRAAEASGDVAAVARAHGGMARYAKAIEDYDDALRALRLSRELAESVGAGEEIAMTIINTVDIWGRIATECQRNDDAAGFERALRQMQPLLTEAFDRADDQDASSAILGFAVGNLADVQILVGNLEEASRLVKIYGDLARNNDCERLPAYAGLDAARISLASGQPADAIRTLTSAEHETALEGEADLAVETQHMLYSAYKIAGDFEHALASLEAYTEHDTKRLEVRAEQRTKVLLARFDTEKALAAAKAAQMDAELNRLKAEAMERHAMQDALTGLGNRRACDGAIDTLLVELRAKQQQRRADDQGAPPLSVAVLDIDYFKQVNDTDGHEAGDQVLCAIGELMARTLRGGDIAYRYGGEEFLLVFPNNPRRSAQAACERVRDVLERYDWSQCSQLCVIQSVTASIGVAEWDGSESKSELINRADKALYQAKHQGRNCVVAA